MMGLDDQRIKVVAGHYGSGKTEFSINLALKIKEDYYKVAIVDLDYFNMYFRIRERTEDMEEMGIKLYSSVLGGKSTLDIPALDPQIMAPLQDDFCQVVVDMGGDPQGLTALARYKDILRVKGYDQILVINRNRPETSDFESVASLIEKVEATSQTRITKLVNTTHMLKDTRVDDLIYGQELVEEVSEKLDIPVFCNACIREVAKDLEQDPRNKYQVFPMDLYFRDHWMV